MSDIYHKYVVIAAPGGEMSQGGIVRQMAYLKDAWPSESDWKLGWLSTWKSGGCKFCEFIKAILKLIWLKQIGRVDVLHLGLASQGSFYRKYLLARLARLMRIPFVVHLHGGGFQDFYDTAPAAVQKRADWLFYQANQCVVLGRQWQHFLELRFRMPYEKTTICYNAVPKAALATPSHEVPHLLYVGQVIARKGVDDLLKALRSLSDLPWRLTIAGSGDLTHYREKAAKYDLQTRVRFVGWVEGKALEAQYEHADILVLPSYIENQPLCVLEAMARGIAVVASRVGTLSEVLDHGRTGLLVEAGNVDQLQAAIRVLLEDASARQKLGKAAHKEFEERFTLERAIEQWRAIYQEVLSF